MSQMDRKRQVCLHSYDGPNPIRMSDESWNVMISALTGEQKKELNELRFRAQCCTQVAVSGSCATAVALELAETAMETLLKKLCELNVSFSLESLSFSGNHA